MPDQMTTRDLHPVIGTEVLGCSITRHLDAQLIEAIKQLWLSHPVLVFRDQDISDSKHVEFARHFGEVELHPSISHRASKNPEIYRVSNVDEAGQILSLIHI